jgi:hypothetical protein
MTSSTPPKIVAVEVVPTKPSEGDSKTIALLNAQTGKSLPQVTYLVKIRLASVPPATSRGWALYVNDFRIPNYWAYEDGIYFKVFDPEFFSEHKGQRLRFSQNESEFVDSGVKLPAPTSRRAKKKGEASRLPLQSEILK